MDFELTQRWEVNRGRRKYEKGNEGAICGATAVRIGHPSDVCTGMGKPPEDHTGSRRHKSNPQMGILSL